MRCYALLYRWPWDWLEVTPIEFGPALDTDRVCIHGVHDFIQSINQTSIAPVFTAKPSAVAQQLNQCSTAQSRKQFHNINRHAGIYGRKAKSKRCVFTCFLKVATEMAERTDSGRLFQRDGAQEQKALAPVLVLTLGTDKLLSFFDLSERGGSDAASMEWR